LELFNNEVAVERRKRNNDIEVPADQQADAVRVGSLDLSAQIPGRQVSKEGSNNIASGTFGACYLANYKGMVVAVKE